MDINTALAKRPPLLRQQLLPHLYAISFFFLMMAASSGAAEVRSAGGAGGSQTPPVPIVLLPGQTYAQNFDGLAAHGTGHPFPPEEKSGLEAGWWTSRPTYSASAGSSTQGGGLFSYGQEGSGERALGSLTSNQVHHTAWGVAFMVDEHETSDTYLWALKVAYNGEQWSAGGFNSTSTLVFDYSIVSTADYERSQKWGYFDVMPGLWMVKDRLSFTSPVTGGEERDLNGNEPANRRAVKHTLAIDDWGKDQIVQLRWTHRDREGKDNAMAIDDFSVTLVPLREVRGSTAAHHRKRTWLYAGISVVGAGLLLIIAGLVVTLIIKRRRNAREGEHSYALLRRDEEDTGLGPGNTSINPPEVDDTDSVRPSHAAESWFSSGL